MFWEVAFILDDFLTVSCVVIIEFESKFFFSTFPLFGLPQLVLGRGMRQKTAP